MRLQDIFPLFVFASFFSPVANVFNYSFQFFSLSACAFFFQLAQRFDKRGTKNSENYLLHSVVVVYFLPTVTTVKYKSNKNNTAATATLTATAEAVTVNALSGLAALLPRKKFEIIASN